jgi:hypothetical protein
MSQNLKRLEESLQGDEIARLNELSPGLGNKLHRMFSGLGSLISAQAGHKGTVAIKKQSSKNSQGIVDAALTMQEDRIAGVDDPIDDLDAVNLRTLRRSLPVIEQVLPTPDKALKQVSRPIGMTNMKTVATDMTATYASDVLNEHLYVVGEVTGTPRLEIYRIFGANEMELLSTFEPSEAFQRMVLHGQYIFGCRTNAASANLTVINISKPDNPEETALFNTTIAARGIHAQEGYIYVAGVGGIKIIDVSTPEAPRIVGSI